MANGKPRRFSFLAHPYWAGIGVIVAIVFGLIAIWQQSEQSSDAVDVTRERPEPAAPSQTTQPDTDAAFVAAAVPTGCASRPASYPFRELVDLSVAGDGTLSRNDAACQSIGWVIERDGQAVISRNASSELQYRYFRDDPGNYCAHIQCYVGDGYRRVSKYVSWTIN